jgi:hypothetical protein
MDIQDTRYGLCIAYVERRPVQTDCRGLRWDLRQQGSAHLAAGAQHQRFHG